MRLFIQQFGGYLAKHVGDFAGKALECVKKVVK
jgi:hypothetical protein